MDAVEVLYRVEMTCHVDRRNPIEVSYEAATDLTDPDHAIVPYHMEVREPSTAVQRCHGPAFAYDTRHWARSKSAGLSLCHVAADL